MCLGQVERTGSAVNVFRWNMLLILSEILQQGDGQVSEPCHGKPVNVVAQQAGGWRTGTPLFRSARNCSFLSLISVGRAETVSILK